MSELSQTIGVTLSAPIAVIVRFTFFPQYPRQLHEVPLSHRLVWSHGSPAVTIRVVAAGTGEVEGDAEGEGKTAADSDGTAVEPDVTGEDVLTRDGGVDEGAVDGVGVETEPESTTEDDDEDPDVEEDGIEGEGETDDPDETDVPDDPDDPDDSDVPDGSDVPDSEMMSKVTQRDCPDSRHRTNWPSPEGTSLTGAYMRLPPGQS